MASARRFDKLDEAIIRELAADMHAIADIVAVEAHVLITSGSASGTETKKHMHEPSKPGEPPNNFSGRLAGGIEVQQPAPLHAQVVSTMEYSRHLEFGTSRMAERPFMRPAKEMTRKEVRARVTKAVDRAIRKFARR